jgi:hypothetical protein
MGCAQDGPNAIMLSVKSVRTSDPELPDSVRYSLDIDVGEFDLGHRLIARSVTLWNDRLFSSTPSGEVLPQKVTTSTHAPRERRDTYDLIFS